MIQHSLCVEVDQHGQVTVDDPLREVLSVLNVEGDRPADGVRKGERSRRGEEGRSA